MQDIKFDFKAWNIKAQERNKGRMKLVIKLGKDEAQAFLNFKQVVKPAEVPEADFMRAIFFHGVETMQEKISSELEKYREEHPEEFTTSGSVDASSTETEASVEIIK